MSSKIFMSYRRADSRWPAKVIRDALIKVIPEDHLFMDVHSIRLAGRFEAALAAALEECELLMAIIGPQWATLTDPETGQRRVDDPGDYVRREIAAALERNVPILPVLVDLEGPPTDPLPDDIKSLFEWQCHLVNYRTCDHDIETLINELKLREKAGGAVVAPSPGLVAPIDRVDSLRDLLTSFLDRYSRWAFSATRIAAWGAKQAGYEALSGHTADAIRNELSSMLAAGLVETRTSQKGGTLYRLRSR